jgi:hypothetical protein
VSAFVAGYPLPPTVEVAPTPGLAVLDPYALLWTLDGLWDAVVPAPGLYTALPDAGVALVCLLIGSFVLFIFSYNTCFQKSSL